MIVRHGKAALCRPAGVIEQVAGSTQGPAMAVAWIAADLIGEDSQGPSAKSPTSYEAGSPFRT